MSPSGTVNRHPVAGRGSEVDRVGVDAHSGADISPPLDLAPESNAHVVETRALDEPAPTPARLAGSENGSVLAHDAAQLAIGPIVDTLQIDGDQGAARRESGSFPLLEEHTEQRHGVAAPSRFQYTVFRLRGLHHGSSP